MSKNATKLRTTVTYSTYHHVFHIRMYYQVSLVINHLQTKVIDSFCRPISNQNRVVNCYEAKLRWMTSTFSKQTLLVLFCLAKYVHMVATPSFLAQEILSPSIFGLYFSIKISVITSAIFLKFFLPYILHVNFSISIRSLL